MRTTAGATLRGDDFWAFYAARAEELLKRIEEAIGKTVSRDPDLFVSDMRMDDDQDELEDWDDEDLPEVDEDLRPAATS